jgi:hypothetical protein
MHLPEDLKIEGTDPSPLARIALLKPEGIAASNKRVKRTYKVRPVKMSEARVRSKSKQEQD